VDQLALLPPPKIDKSGDAHSGACRSGARNNADNGNKNKCPRIKRPPYPVTTNNRYGANTEEMMESDIDPDKG